MSETGKIKPVDQRLIRQFGEVWVAAQDGMAAIGATRKEALAGLSDCLKCKTSLQIIHTWATFQGGRELVPKHVENLTTKTLDPFRLPKANVLARGESATSITPKLQ
jgi:hypothetical protein